jgi:hypothetical protein
MRGPETSSWFRENEASLEAAAVPAQHHRPSGPGDAVLRSDAPGLGLQLLFFKASTAAEIDAAFAAFADARAEALFIAPMASLPTNTSKWPRSRRAAKYPPAILLRTQSGMVC